MTGPFGRAQLAAAFMSSCVLISAPAAAADRTFDIPAQSLASALTTWARQANVQVFFPSEAIQGRRSALVRGSMSPRAALDRLIEGTDLQVTSDDGRTVILARPDAAAQAADTPAEDTTDNDIVVTGIRRSLADALAAKRDASTIVDAISAEDIGRFPDQNLAESLQRVPGVQITRNKGEGSSVSVRGLGANFTRTFYNGRILPSPTAGRNFAFTSLSSDFVSRVEVQKSPTADLIDGGVAATVNVQVARPLDAGRSRTAVIVEGLYESNPDQWSPHIAFYTSQVLADGRLGFNFGASYEKRNVIQGGYTGYGMENRAETDRSPAYDFNLDGAYNGSYRFNHAVDMWIDDGTFERLSFVGGVQARPFDNVEIYSDFFYSRFKDNFLRSQHSLRFTNLGGPGATIVATEIDEGNVVSYLDADGVDHRATVRQERNRDEVLSVAVGGKAEFGALTVSGQGTYSDAEALSSALNVNAISRASASYDMRNGYGEIPEVSYNRGFDPLDPTVFRLLSIAGNINSPRRDRNRDLRIDANYDVDGAFLQSVQVGGYFGRTTKTFETNSINVSSRIAAQVLGLPFDPAIEGGTAAAESFLALFDYSQFVGDALGIHLAPDLDKLFASASLEDLLQAAPPISQPSNNYSVREDVYALYARANFGTDDGRLSGNIGLRYVKTDQESDGAAPDLTKVILLQGDVSVLVPVATPVTVSNNYENWLPSLNLRWSPAPQFAVRLALARAMTRPDLGILSPRTTISANVRTINSGNPMVRPYLADQADLSFEYYLGRTGILSAAVFYKDVKNFIVTTQTIETHTLLRELGGTTTLEFRRSQPDNGAGGTVKGIELAAQIPLTFLPGLLDGFGIISNLTLLDVSDVRVVQDGPLVPVAGVSDVSYTLGGYYEKHGFGIRASYTYRSGYVESQSSNFGDGSYYDPYGQLDISASYDVNDNLSIVAEAVNVTNGIQSTHNDIGVLRQTFDFGRRIAIGARLKF
jgi:TonB-dependent receptor